MQSSSRRTRLFSLFTILTMLVIAASPLSAAQPAAPAAPALTQVNVAGSFESEIGGADWSNNDALTNLADANNDEVWKFSAAVPAGNYEYKIVEDGDWSKAYPASNVPFTVSADGKGVTWYYDATDHYVADNANKVIASVPGNYQSKIGCSGDWQPDCLKSLLKGPDVGGIYTFSTVAIPAGAYEAKVALNESWDINYGVGGEQGGPNLAFTVKDGEQVTFTYDSATHVLTITAAAPLPTYTVALVGSLQSEIGCAGDWDPACPNTELTYDANDDVWQATFDLPAGSFEYKVALNNSWDVSYGANAQLGGANIPLTLATAGKVKFYYDHKSHWVADNVGKVIATVPGSYQKAMGCAGDWDPGCLRSWLQDPEGDGSYSFTTTKIPAGSYEAKVAINEGWDVNYGQGGEPGGANYAFTVATAGDPVTFTYDAATHILTIETVAPPVKLPDYAVIHYTRPGGDYDGWGLHLWGDAIDPAEGTSWGEPKLFTGQDDYGKYVAIKLKDATKPINFIIHKGNDKDTPSDRSFYATKIPENWLVQGDAANHGSRADALKKTVIHYKRADGDYTGWGLHLWGDAIDPTEATQWGAPKLPTGTDDYGAYYEIKLADPTKPVNFIVHKGDVKDPDADRSYTPADAYAVWLRSGNAKVYAQRGAAEGVALLHYRRVKSDYAGWGLHVWGDSAEPDVTWGNPLQPAGADDYGIYWKVRLTANPATLNYIVHKGDTKDPGPDQSLALADKGFEIWLGQGTGTQYTSPAIALAELSGGKVGDLTKQQAHWVSRDTIAWAAATTGANTYTLHYDANAGLALEDAGVTGGQTLALTYDPAGLGDAIKAKFPQLAGYGALKIAAADLAKVPDILKGQFAVSVAGPDSKVLDATGLQIPGVLDDLYTYDGDLGVTWKDGAPTLKLWAPTAQSVVLLQYIKSGSVEIEVERLMTLDPATGVWSITGQADWKGTYYSYIVKVFAPTTGKIVTNVVTDPYSLSLSTNSKRSQIVDLADAALKPAGWDASVKPPLAAPEDISIYELHVRDFSANDLTVPEAYRGTYKAFTVADSDGMKHLKALADAGLTHVHLLPVFDIASVNEDKSQWQAPDPAVLATYPADSDQQQAAVGATVDKDGFNWGYDPLHYTTPEGSYATNPDGTTRIGEFREMVQALNASKLRVVMDVVYNHTNASGQSENSVLDRIVPGYYHRLDDSGKVTNSTCCANTATEHAMMEKLMVDSVVTWAKYYKVDGFRFDLMGHHMVSNMLKVRQALDALTPATDGVDGKAVYLYGEGWNFGEVADNARGVNATQINLAGTGIGTFNDRLRDAVRGGSPTRNGNTDLEEQGFSNGLSFDPNGYDQGAANDVKARLLLFQDQLRVGLAGNLADYQFVDRTGAVVSGKDVTYNGAPAGYTKDPQENIVYVEAHDNQTLYDNNIYRAPVATGMADRVRIQELGLSLAALSQGVPFFHAGSEILRSKSLDRNSYNSGDWFNKLDFTYQSNNFGVGLPLAGDNQSNWDKMKPLLASAALKPAQADIEQSMAVFQDWLKIRKSSPLFRLQTAQQIEAVVRFYNTGPDQLSGLIVERLADTGFKNIDPAYDNIVVLFNANDEAQTYAASDFAGHAYTLHPIQASGADPVVKTATFDKATGAFTVPARTTAVFVEKERLPYRTWLFPVFKNAPLGPVAPSDEDKALVRAPIQYAADDSRFYFVLPDRFANGSTANDFGADAGGTTVTDTLRHGFLPTSTGYYHGGDLLGLTEKLDYLSGMGVNALWITPPVVNKAVQGDGTIAGSTAGYHGYWGTDFLNVDPHLGTRADFNTFIAAAHQRGIKVYLDIVVNATADVIQYQGGQTTYRSKADYPYRDAAGKVFDDRDYAGKDTFPALDAATSFPYVPIFATDADRTIKNPAWLNNPIYYHNRGNSTFRGENSQYGDFYGLDDVFTEQPAVVNGWIDVYKQWIDAGADGFRLDTVKHVNLEFWQKFGPALMSYAQSKGKADFFMFGEVYDGDPAFTSVYTTQGKLPAVLDFAFQGQATSFAVQGAATDKLRDLFAADDYYTDADSSAAGLAKFVSNHDLGRLGYALQTQLPDAPDAEKVAREKLGYALMYFTRGFPITYYGDEQGFVGGGSDQAGREDMMPSQVASYNAEDLLGTDKTTADANFDADHVLYRALKQFGQLHQDNLALRRGAQIHRYSSAKAGVYAFSRFDRDEKVEYVLAFNNAATPQRVTFPTYMANTAFTAVYPVGAAAVTTGWDKQITLEVPALNFVIYRASKPLAAPTLAQAAPEGVAAPDAAPLQVSFTQPGADGKVIGRAEIAVNLSNDRYAEVTFAVKQGNGAYQVIGTDANPPYRVFYDVSSLPISTTLTFKAIANDLFGTLASAQKEAVVTQVEPEPVDAGYAVIHYNRPAGDYTGWGLHLWGDAIDPTEATQWGAPKQPTGTDDYGAIFEIKLADPTKPVNFIIHKGDTKDTDADRSYIPAKSQAIWLKSDDAAVYAQRGAAESFAMLHYRRTAGDYDGWGLHMWTGFDGSVSWGAPFLPTGTDAFGVVFKVPLTAGATELAYILHKGDTKDLPDDQFLELGAKGYEVWILQSTPGYLLPMQ